MVGNSERLVGMVAQFDEGDKDYLTQKEVADFVDFFLEESDPAITQKAAKASLNCG